jgi:transcriptional regulator with XRE-family HTH domain
MVHAPSAPDHGARSYRRAVTPDLAAMLRSARTGRGWSVRQAAQRAGVTPGTIAHLERARRSPSLIVAEAIAGAYELEPAAARALLAEAVSGAGRSSPFRAARRYAG